MEIDWIEKATASLEAARANLEEAADYVVPDAQKTVYCIQAATAHALIAIGEVLVHGVIDVANES